MGKRNIVSFFGDPPLLEGLTKNSNISAKSIKALSVQFWLITFLKILGLFWTFWIFQITQLLWSENVTKKVELTRSSLERKCPYFTCFYEKACLTRKTHLPCSRPVMRPVGATSPGSSCFTLKEKVSMCPAFHWVTWTC